MAAKTGQPAPRVGLFVTCLIDAMRPSAGLAALDLLTDAGCHVIIPETQTCCGQPAWNGGDAAAARKVARVFLHAFDDCDYIVVPSGSCGGMLSQHLPQLFADADKAEYEKACAIAEKTHELTAFLCDIMNYRSAMAMNVGRIAYHDSCSCLREMKVKEQPRKLLEDSAAGTVLETADNEVCCGFGGLFSVKYDAISTAMADRKLDAVLAAEPDMLVAADLGCLMHLAGRLRRRDSVLPVRHIAEVLAGDASTAPLAGNTDETSSTGDGAGQDRMTGRR